MGGWLSGGLVGWLVGCLVGGRLALIKPSSELHFFFLRFPSLSSVSRHEACKKPARAIGSFLG